MEKTIEIILADSNDLSLIGSWAVLLQNPEFDVVAAVTQVDTLMTVTRHFKPDVIILDENLYPQLDIYQTIQQLQAIVPTVKLIILGELYDGLHMRDLFHAGVLSYLYRQDRLQDCLVSAVRTVLRNRKYLSPTANAEYLVAMQSPQRDWQLDPEARKILQMLAHGHRVCEIATALNIDTRRVYFVRQKLRKRFNADTNEHLISVAVAERFICL
ncbi:MAG: response regulator transcription factor [Phototrophicaceae bacterium]